MTRWSSFWRYLGALAISAVATATYVEVDLGDTLKWRLWVDASLGLVSLLLVHRRRKNPLFVGVVTGLLASFSASAAGPATLAAVSVATSRRWTPIVAVGMANLVGAHVFLWYLSVPDEIPLWINGVINVVAISAIMGWGMFIGSRRELLWTLRDRAERAEAERDLRSDKARGDERARIAREMHDVLAHRISQVSMHAGALAFREDLSAAQMRSSAGVIQEQANLALTDLRAVLGVLRDPGTGELLSKPQPGFGDIEELIDEARLAGMSVEYAVSLPAEAQLPERVGRTLYRIVQEGLTNARKHAAGTTVFVQISADPEQGIDFVMRNPLGFGTSPAPGSRLGLIGLTERTELIGGELEHRKDGSMFVLHGWIPWST
nr:histidine kinase [Nocardioides daedukensis]